MGSSLVKPLAAANVSARETTVPRPGVGPHADPARRGPAPLPGPGRDAARALAVCPLSCTEVPAPRQPSSLPARHTAGDRFKAIEVPFSRIGVHGIPATRRPCRVWRRGRGDGDSVPEAGSNSCTHATSA
eukprot:5729788-Prymnesium_polylepis.2